MIDIKHPKSNEFRECVENVKICLIDKTGVSLPIVYDKATISWKESTKVFEDSDLDATFVWQPVFKERYNDTIESQLRVTNGHQMIEMLEKMYKEGYQVRLSERNTAKVHAVNIIDHPINFEGDFNDHNYNIDTLFDQASIELFDRLSRPRIFVKVARVESDGKISRFVNCYLIDRKLVIDGRERYEIRRGVMVDYNESIGKILEQTTYKMEDFKRYNK